MLNLFKLPFLVDKATSNTSHAYANFATGLLSNLLKQSKDISEEGLDNAYDIALREMEHLQTMKEYSPSVDDYEMMTNVLRRIEQAVHSSHR